VLVTSGGYGVGPLSRIVRSFAGVPGVRLTVVCGAAESTRVEIDRLARSLGVAADVLGFESDMPARVAEAHVVVGKAGGLTVSEAMSAGRPLVIVGAVPGNEKQNEAFVVSARAGVAAEPEEVARVVVGMWGSGALPAMGLRGRIVIAKGAAERVLAVHRDDLHALAHEALGRLAGSRAVAATLLAEDPRRRAVLPPRKGLCACIHEFARGPWIWSPNEPPPIGDETRPSLRWS
jgi:hypothetical protein